MLGTQPRQLAQRLFVFKARALRLPGVAVGCVEHGRHLVFRWGPMEDVWGPRLGLIASSLRSRNFREIITKAR